MVRVLYEVNSEVNGCQASNVRIVLCTIPLQINQNRKEGPLPVTPKIAIVSLLSWMGKSGYSGDFYDIDMLLPSEHEIFDYFKFKQPDVVGISAVVSTSYLQTKHISKLIREACPSAWIVLGGNMAAAANVLLRKTEVDVCVLGDGEKTWVNLLDYVRKHGTNRNVDELLKIKGIAFLNAQDEMECTGYGESITNDEIPFPDYEILTKGLLSRPELIENYFREGTKCDWFKHDTRTYESNRKPKLAVLWTSKGCVGRCTFCQRFCKGYRVLSLKKLDNHLSELKQKYDVGFIQVVDENFGSNKQYSYEVAKLMKKHGILWFCGGVQCTSFTLEDMKFLNECGCTGMKFGVESGSPKILNVMEKRFTVQNVKNALRNAYEAGMYAPLSFYMGMPGENDETIMATGRFIGENARMLGIPPNELDIGLFWALPLPGAPLYEYGQLQGVISSSVDDEEAFLISVSDKNISKNNFINLTGVGMRQVLFWDFMSYSEAMRSFGRTRIKLGNTKKNLLPLASKIPAFILYPVLRNLLFINYIFRGNIRFQRKCKPLMEAQSLREINREITEQLPAPLTLTERNQRILRLGR